MKVIVRKPSVGYIDRWLWVPKMYVSVDPVKSALTHVLSDSYTGKERILYLWRETRDHLLVPRAFWDPMKLPFPVIDCRPQSYPRIEFEHKIKLDHRLKKIDGVNVLQPTGSKIQQKSVQALLGAQGGILQLACGLGKTVIALYKIAEGKVPALVMCDNTNLMYQWCKEVESLLIVPGGVGVFGAGKHDWRHGLVLATYQSVANWSDTIDEEARCWFGQVFFEEGHHLSAPTFAATADMFYGNRYSLTATPERDDGLHVISTVHIGNVLYKDLTPTMLPSFAFYWSGLELDLRDPTVVTKVMDCNQEVSLSKVNGFFGQWTARLNILMDIVTRSQRNGRVTLLLSNSVDEVVNLMTLFERGPSAVGNLYTDIPTPTPQELGETLTPLDLSPRDMSRLEKKRKALEKQKIAANSKSSDVTVIDAEITQIAQALKQNDVFRKIQNELAKRRKKYILELIAASQKCGLLTYDVPHKDRQRMLETKDVIFAVTKYGKEGMNCPRLDTVILSSLFSSRNGLQQLMGRPTRPMPGKKPPILLAIVDNVGQCIGMSKKLIGHLRDWPREEGGPYEPILIGYPGTSWTNKKNTTTLSDLLGQ